MRIPIIGEGFGCFSRILGPWTDYFPSQLQQPDAQFGVCLGTQIRGGDKGATISFITVEPPFNIFGNNGAITWRCIVLQGPVPSSVYPYQRAQNGWPIIGDSDQDKPPLFDRLIAAATTQNNATSTQQPHYPFPDLSGPSCGPGDVMSVLLLPLFNETGVPGYGASNKTYASLTVGGLYTRRTDVGGNADQTARSIPRNRVGRG